MAAEQLCVAYAANFGISSVSLRYFTVYGPRQRPDMATNRLIAAARFGTPFPMFGDGSQIRDFTFVGDVVAANLAAVEADVAAGSVFNVAGGDSCTLAELIDLVGREVGSPVPLDRRPAQPGDVFGVAEDEQLLFRLRPIGALAFEDILAAQHAFGGDVQGCLFPRYQLAVEPGKGGGLGHAVSSRCRSR